MVPVFAVLKLGWLPAALVAGYFGVGLWWALRGPGRLTLAQRASALVAWPFLWGEAPAPEPTTAPAVPARIERCFGPLLDDLRRHPEPPFAASELLSLRERLVRAAARVEAADGILRDGVELHTLGATVAQAYGALREARNRADAEIDAVLAGVVQLRVQLGLVALAGSGSSARDLLDSLDQRMRALDEVVRVVTAPTGGSPAAPREVGPSLPG